MANTQNLTQYNGRRFNCTHDGAIYDIIDGAKRDVGSEWANGKGWDMIDCGLLDSFPEYYEQYYSRLFPASIETLNCSQIKGYKLAVEEEMKNIDKRHLPGGDLSVDSYYAAAQAAIGRIAARVNTTYALLDCENQITTNQTKETFDYIQQAGTAAKSSGSNNVGIYFVYGASALLILGGGFLLFRKMKN